MLVLTRKLGQRLIINQDVVVTVLSVRNGQVRIGIDAPRSVPIQREEIAHREMCDSPSATLFWLCGRVGASKGTCRHHRRHTDTPVRFPKFRTRIKISSGPQGGGPEEYRAHTVRST